MCNGRKKIIASTLRTEIIMFEHVMSKMGYASSNEFEITRSKNGKSLVMRRPEIFAIGQKSRLTSEIAVMSVIVPNHPSIRRKLTKHGRSGNGYP